MRKPQKSKTKQTKGSFEALRVSADENRAVRVVHHTVADAAHQGSPDGVGSACAHHYQHGAHRLLVADDLMPRVFATHQLEHAVHLKHSNQPKSDFKAYCAWKLSQVYSTIRFRPKVESVCFSLPLTH